MWFPNLANSIVDEALLVSQEPKLRIVLDARYCKHVFTDDVVQYTTFIRNQSSVSDLRFGKANKLLADMLAQGRFVIHSEQSWIVLRIDDLRPDKTANNRCCSSQRLRRRGIALYPFYRLHTIQIETAVSELFFAVVANTPLYRLHHIVAWWLTSQTAITSPFLQTILNKACFRFDLNPVRLSITVVYYNQ